MPLYFAFQIVTKYMPVILALSLQFLEARIA
jgi:hypothetical protein